MGYRVHELINQGLRVSISASQVGHLLPLTYTYYPKSDYPRYLPPPLTTRLLIIPSPSTLFTSYTVHTIFTRTQPRYTGRRQASLDPANRRDRVGKSLENDLPLHRSLAAVRGIALTTSPAAAAAAAAPAAAPALAAAGPPAAPNTLAQSQPAISVSTNTDGAHTHTHRHTVQRGGNVR